MIDFSNWHEKNEDEKLRARLWISEVAPYDKDVQQILKALFKKDIIFFIEAILWTHDSKSKPNKDLPFILWPKQKELVKWMQQRYENKENGLLEKARQGGGTWLGMAFIYYYFILGNKFHAILGSKKEDTVDKKGLPICLFWKLDYFIERTPKWLLPGFNPKKDRNHLLLLNRNRGNAITGESSNPDLARGGNYNLSFLDEFAIFPYAESAWTSVSAAADTNFLISTPKPFCYFKTLRFSGQIPVFTLPWTVNPNRDEKWLNKQREKYSDEIIQQEYLLNYDVTGRGSVYEEIDLVQVGNYPYNPKLSLYTGSDFGLKDDTAIIWAQKDEQGNIYVIDTYHNADKTIFFYLPFYTGEISSDNPYKYDYTKEEKEKIKLHANWKRARHFSDPAGKNRSQVTDTSVISTLAKHNVHMFTNDRANSFAARREATKMLLRSMYVNEGNTYFMECIANSRYPQRREGSQATKGITKPVHDSNSHYRSALEYLAVNLNLKGAPPRKVNYLKNLNKKVKTDDEGHRTEEQVSKEKTAKIIRYSWRSY